MVQYISVQRGVRIKKGHKVVKHSGATKISGLKRDFCHWVPSLDLAQRVGVHKGV
jgi:hypothetical protein